MIYLSKILGILTKKCKNAGKSIKLMPLTEAEMRVTNGGWIGPFIIGAIVGGMIYDLVNNTDQVIEAIDRGGTAAREQFR
jgi:hypothetical protein